MRLRAAISLLALCGVAEAQTTYIPFNPRGAAAASDPIADNCTFAFDFNPADDASAYCGATLCDSGDEDVRVDSVQTAQGFTFIPNGIGTTRGTWNFQDSRTNSLSSISFDNNDNRGYKNATLSQTQPFTVYSVAIDTSATNETIRTIGEEGGAGNVGGGVNSTPRGFSNAGTGLTGSLDPGQTLRIFTHVYNSTSSEMNIDDGQFDSASGDAGTNDLSNGARVGNYPGGDQAWTGAISRVIVCDGAHNATTQDLITDELGSIYGVTVD